MYSSWLFIISIAIFSQVPVPDDIIDNLTEAVSLETDSAKRKDSTEVPFTVSSSFHDMKLAS